MAGRKRIVRLTLAGFLFEKVGFWGAPRVLGLLVAWVGYLELHSGKSPRVEDLAGPSSKSISQWYRDQVLFRKAFPGEVSPDRIARLLWSRYHARTVAELAGVPLVELEVAA
jgi:hypothetical protein